MKFQTTLGLAIVATAAPTEKPHELTYEKRNGDKAIPFFYPSGTYSYKEPSGAASLLPTSDEEMIKIGTEHLVKNLGISVTELQVTNSHKSSDGVMHIYATRLINGVPVSNQNAAVHVLNGEVIGESASFSNAANLVPQSIAPTQTKITLERAVKIAEAEYGIKRDSFPAYNAYVEIPGNKVVFTHVFQLRDDKTAQWFQVSVDAQTGQVVQVVDYVNNASFKVVGLPKINPLNGFGIVTNPEDPKASPNGWSTSTSTIGNNVDSRIGSLRADGGSSKNFDTNWVSSQEPTTDANKRAAIVNNFYVSNMVHDITYQYGFDEVSGNFQSNNFGRGGRGGDIVNINNQASGSNNANFATPPDGQSPTMNMFLWTLSTPRRDGSLENSVPIHEYGHGISNRLTGGPSNTNCLNSLEAGGMGEGWSDSLAMFMTWKESDTRASEYALGSYVYNNPKGIRQYVYSTNSQVNPLTYNSVSKQNAVHQIGTTWATVLNEMYWNFRDRYGFSANLYDAKQLKGNIMALQVMIAGMKLQPCNPTFLSARDAILSATQTYYGAEAKCLAWKAFAKRGLGTNAVRSGYTNGFALPSECSGYGTATLSKGYLLTPKRKIIEATVPVLKHFKCRYVVENGVAKRRRLNPIKEEEEEQFYYTPELFEEDPMVNVAYTLTFLVYYSKDPSRQVLTYIFRNIKKSEIDQMIEWRSNEFKAGQCYNTVLNCVEYKVEPVPLKEVPLLEQRMYGTNLRYNYLSVDSNDSTDNTCVYDYLMKQYGIDIKGLTPEYLMNLFDEPSLFSGVTTSQILKFCKLYKISCYSLDLEMNVFNKYIPDDASHKLKALVYIVSNDHLYPIVDKALRDSVFRKESSKTSGKVGGYKKNVNKDVFDILKKVVFNPSFSEIQSFKDVNVVFDDIDTNTLLPLVEYLYKTEQTVYTTEGCNGNIIKIKYKDGVEISINHHYKVAKKNAEALKIPFRNQNIIQLANEYLKVYTDGDEWKSVFNKQARDMILGYKVGIFNHTFYEPEEGSELKGADINKCHTYCWSDGNEYPWLVYNALDEIRPYLKKQDEPLKDGKYYVETDNYFPLKGNNWYHRVSLEF